MENQCAFIINREPNISECLCTTSFSGVMAKIGGSEKEGREGRRRRKRRGRREDWGKQSAGARKTIQEYRGRREKNLLPLYS